MQKTKSNRINECIEDSPLVFHFRAHEVDEWNERMDKACIGKERGCECFSKEDNVEAPKFEKYLSTLIDSEWSKGLDFVGAVKRNKWYEVREILDAAENIDRSTMTWGERFDEANLRGFTKHDLKIAENWRHCAVGDKLELENIHIENAGAELTIEAWEKGCYFTNQVRHGKVKEAVKSYNEIQEMENMVVGYRPSRK